MNKWKDKPCSWIETCRLLRMSIFPKMIYTFNTFPDKFTAEFFIDMQMLILKFLWKAKGTIIDKYFLKEQRWQVCVARFWLTLKPSWLRQCDIGERRSISLSGTESRIQNKPMQIQSIGLWQKCKGNSMGKGLSFWQIFLEQLDIHMQKKNELNLYFTHYTKINSK